MDSTVIIVLGIILLALIILNNITLVQSPSPVGGCAGTQYGCCMDGTTTKMNAYGTNCQPAPYPPVPPPPPPPPYPPVPPPPPPQPIGGCAGTQYGCCPNTTTPKFNQQGTNCPNYPQPIGGCAGTQYGCCPNKTTPKFNQQGTNCPNYPK